MRDLLNSLAVALDGRDLRVFLWMLTKTNERGEITTTHEEIGEALTLSPATVKRSLLSLRTAQLLSGQRGGPHGQKYRFDDGTAPKVCKGPVLHNSQYRMLFGPEADEYPSEQALTPSITGVTQPGSGVNPNMKDSSQMSHLSKDSSIVSGLDRSPVSHLPADSSPVSDLDSSKMSHLAHAERSEAHLPKPEQNKTTAAADAGACERASGPARESEERAKAAAAELKSIGFSDHAITRFIESRGSEVVEAAIRRAKQVKPNNFRAYVRGLVMSDDFAAEVEADATIQADRARKRARQERQLSEQEQRAAEADEEERAARKAASKRFHARLDKLTAEQLLSVIAEAANRAPEGLARRVVRKRVQSISETNAKPRDVAASAVMRPYVIQTLDARENGPRVVPVGVDD